MAIEILKPPPFIPGQGMSELMKDVVRIAYSTTLSVSTTMSTAIELFKVPANTLILHVGAEVTTTFDGGSSDVGLTIGDSDDADALLTLELSSLLAAGTVGALLKNYTAAQAISAFFTPGEGVTGGLRIWATFKTDSNTQEIAE